MKPNQKTQENTPRHFPLKFFSYDTETKIHFKDSLQKDPEGIKDLPVVTGDMGFQIGVIYEGLQRQYGLQKGVLTKKRK